MGWIIALIWIAASFTFAGLIGRVIRFGMTGEITPRRERAEVRSEIVALH